MQRDPVLDWCHSLNASHSLFHSSFYC